MRGSVLYLFTTKNANIPTRFEVHKAVTRKSSIFRNIICEAGSKLAASLHDGFLLGLLLSLRMEENLPPERSLTFTKLYSITSEKAELFKDFYVLQFLNFWNEDKKTSLTCSQQECSLDCSFQLLMVP